MCAPLLVFPHARCAPLHWCPPMSDVRPSIGVPPMSDVRPSIGVPPMSDVCPSVDNNHMRTNN